MRLGIYSDNEIINYLTKSYAGTGFVKHLENRLIDFAELPKDEKIEINQKSLKKARKIALLPLQTPGIFLVGNGNIRLMFENEQESFGVQILELGLQVVQLSK